jgi:Tol biopolymer transport system component
MSSDVNGNRDIWIMNADGSGRKQLTNDPGGDAQPTVSRDGRHIAFTSTRVKGTNHLFLMDIDGGNVRQLTKGAQEVLASFSPDGQWIYFLDESNGPWKNVKKISINGGESTVVATAPDGWVINGIDVNTADGRLVYGLMNGNQYRLGIVSPKGETKLIDLPANLSSERPRWALDNRTVAVVSRIEGLPLDVWSIPVNAKGKPRQLTDFRTPGSVDPRWTTGGKQLFVVRGTWASIPVLIRNNGN